MWHKAVTLTLLTLTLSTTATPIPSLKHAKEVSITEAQILQIAPTSNTCENPPAEGECATASQAAKFISQSFDNYDVTSKAEQAAVIGLMAFESDEFKYNKNHFPGTPGQGTRNMQSPDYNKKYASSIPALKDKLPPVENSPADLLDLLRDNEVYDFGSGAWFLTTQCSADIRTALKAGTESGWSNFITQCVGTDASSDRKSYWQKAVKALG
ncbi:hypothetical protein N7493_007206 [Penicillium malachiteum]|uniref:Uncharacterized protein n=1 Tax=Penicillium malachiteum TaxID=1324776 RepID=A0AAD6HIY3_9EURO|nr:hypothetical protein N7493_007206 [Penicillium malachiteum]